MKSMKKIAAVLAVAMSVSAFSALPAAAVEKNYSEAEVKVSEAAATTYATDSIIKSAGYKTSYTSRYAYSKLTSTEKTLYKRIVAAVKNVEPIVELPSNITNDQILRVYTLVFNSEPQFFWMDSSYTKGAKYLYVNYKVTDLDEIETMQNAINKQVKSLLSKAKKQSTTFGKLKVFYDYLVLNNDSIVDRSGYNASIYGAFNKKEDLQCAGYAKAMQYLCDLSGITCMVIIGNNEAGGTHAWNIVKCGDGYYNLDSTWGDPVNEYGSDYIQYEFFLVPDKWIKNISHFNANVVVDSKGNKVKLFTPPSCTKTKYNYFIKNGLNYSSSSKALSALKSQMKNAVKNKKNVVEIRVTTKELYNTMLNKTNQQALNKYAKSLSSNVKSISVHTSNITKGSYVVHYDINYKK